jgi:hypothetical protein
MSTKEDQFLDSIKKLSTDIDTIKSNQHEFAKSIAIIDEIKTATKAHSENLEKHNELIVGANGILWIGKIFVAIGTVAGGVWAFFFRHNS